MHLAGTDAPALRAALAASSLLFPLVNGAGAAPLGSAAAPNTAIGTPQYPAAAALLPQE